MDEEAFFSAYEELAEDGLCDTPGGAEYERILDEWIDLGCPNGIEAFIVSRANAVPKIHNGRESLVAWERLN